LVFERRWDGEVVVCRVELRAWWNDLIDPVEDVLAQLDVRAGEEILEVFGLPGADEDRRDGGVRPDECRGQVRQRHSHLVGKFGELVDGFQFRLVCRYR